MKSELFLLSALAASFLLSKRHKKAVNSAHRHWRSMGEYYGYPTCCIEEFLQKNKVIDRSVEQERVSGSGFVPCHAHAVAILERKIKIEDLILSSRKHPKPFRK